MLGSLSFLQVSVIFHFQDIALPWGLEGRVAGAWIQSLVHSVQFLCVTCGWKGQKGQEKGIASPSQARPQIRPLCYVSILGTMSQEITLLQVLDLLSFEKNEMVSWNDHFSYSKKFLGPMGQASCSFFMYLIERALN